MKCKRCITTPSFKKNLFRRTPAAFLEALGQLRSPLRGLPRPPRRSATPRGEDSFFQLEAGMLSDAAFNSYVAGVKFYFPMLGMRAAWKLLEAQFGSDFRSFGSAMPAQTKATSQSADAYAAWRNLLAAELRTADKSPGLSKRGPPLRRETSRRPGLYEVWPYRGC